MSETKERIHGGFHSILENDHPYIFIDTTMQIWPDADFENAHRHGVTAYAVTACRPQTSFENAVKDIMEWHRYGRLYEHLSVAETVADIRDAKKRGDAVLISLSLNKTPRDSRLKPRYRHLETPLVSVIAVGSALPT